MGKNWGINGLQTFTYKRPTFICWLVPLSSTMGGGGGTSVCILSRSLRFKREEKLPSFGIYGDEPRARALEVVFVVFRK